MASLDVLGGTCITVIAGSTAEALDEQPSPSDHRDDRCAVDQFEDAGGAKVTSVEKPGTSIPGTSIIEIEESDAAEAPRHSARKVASLLSWL
jgi:hypothetical protein